MVAVITLGTACGAETDHVDEPEVADDRSGDGGSDVVEGGDVGGEADSIAAPTSGELRVLTYNVAGLPQGLSSSDPETNIPLISPLLGAYELVLVQEDFWYYEELRTDVSQPYRSTPAIDPPNVSNMGDGLNRFSVSPFDQHTRTPWPGCNGTLDCSSDCLASKGMSFARHELAPGVEVDVYNLHNEAGGCPEDFVIREESTDLLIATIEGQSAGRAVIVGGDFNLHERDEEDLALLRRLWDFGLRESCHEVDCGEDQIDRIMVRDGDSVRLEVLEWSHGEEFVTDRGAALSDHPAIWARLRWTHRES